MKAIEHRRFLVAQPEGTRRSLLDQLAESERRQLLHFWPFWAREEQLPPPGSWHNWLILAGRGFGKTRAGAEWVRQIALSDGNARIALVASSILQARAVLVEGESGILPVHGPGKAPHFESSLRRLVWPNGAQATLYSAAEPESLRGPQHSHAWCYQAQKELTINEALARVDGLLHPSVQGEANTPPADPLGGECWIVGSSPDGDWAANAGDLAVRQSGNWLFSTPIAGLNIYDMSDGQFAYFDGSWLRATEVASPTGGSAPDMEARAAITEILAALRVAGILPR